VNANQLSKLNMYLSTRLVLEANEPVYRDVIPAFETAADDFIAIIPEIRALAQTQSSKTGAADEKAAVLEDLGNAAFTVAAAVRAWASASSNKDLARRVNFSRSEIAGGRESEIVARCQDIWAAATANVDALPDYGVNAPRLTALKKKIDAFDAIQSKPRQKIASSSAATKALTKLFKQADVILNERLDTLVVQFRESQPGFYNAYKTARSIVNQPGGHNGNGETNTTTATSASLIKAA
jgi:hypothetical protein